MDLMEYCICVGWVVLLVVKQPLMTAVFVFLSLRSLLMSGIGDFLLIFMIESNESNKERIQKSIDYSSP